MRILYVEDDPSMALSIGLMLKAARIAAEHASTAESALELAGLYRYDAILLDLGLPDMDGMRALRRLRDAGCRCPVMVVSGAMGVEARVDALRAGADDFVTKPFAQAELVSRIAALVRRSRGMAGPLVEVGPLSVDIDAKLARLAGRAEPLDLTRYEYLILENLALRQGHTLSKQDLLDALYGGVDSPEEKIIDVYMCKLRRKVSPPGEPALIHTVWGRGYLLSDTYEAKAA